MGIENAVIPRISGQETGHGLILLRAVGQAFPIVAVQHHALVHLHVIPQQAVHGFRPPRLAQIDGHSAQHAVFVLQLDLKRETPLLRALQNGADGLLPELFPHRSQKQAGEGGEHGRHNRCGGRDLSF